MNPLVRYVRARLHRRIFLWFGASILFTGLAFTGFLYLAGRTPMPPGPPPSPRSPAWLAPWYVREIDRGRVLVSHMFERVWEKPMERDMLARDISRDLGLGLTLFDAKRSAIASFGPPCEVDALSAPVLRGDEAIGFISACPVRDRNGPRRGGWFFVPFLLLGAAIWIASGGVARRLARPLGELERMARDIGSGRLKSRVRLDCRRHGEIGIVGEAMNDMAARIERQLADQRELLAAVSHELRTPLARIRLLTEIARDTGTTEKTLDEIDREVIEIDALVGDLLASSRIDFTALDLRDLDVGDTARRALERAGQSIQKLHIGDKSLRVSADATLLGRAMANLIGNAEKHGGGLVQFRAEKRANTIVFEAYDSGPGFGEGEAERAFQPFYTRARRDSEKDSLGLGLSLVKRIAEAHGGRAYAKNREEGGACVGIELPESAEKSPK